MTYYEAGWLDETSGLLVSGGVTIDGSSGYPDELVQDIKEIDGAKDWAEWRRIRNDPQLLKFKTLSTNCIYYYSYTILDHMEKILTVPHRRDRAGKASRIKSAINRRFWDSRNGCYQYVISDDYQYNYQEGIGNSLCLLLGIPDKAMAAAVFAHQHITDYGIPITWPSFKRYEACGKLNHFGHINCIIWPEADGFWAHAAAAYGKHDALESSLMKLARLAVRPRR